MIGVNFQPGSNQNGMQNGQQTSPTGGIQEAIKILSLRLPKVVGAQSASPMPLLTSQGSGGNPRVDSIVNQIMARLGPQMGQSQPSAPMMPQGAPSFGGAASTPYQPPQQQQQQQPPWGNTMPRVVVGPPAPRWPGQAQIDGGSGPFPGNSGMNGGAPPPIPPGWGDLGSNLGSYGGGAQDPFRFDEPLF
jgi:hypothetical protein